MSRPQITIGIAFLACCSLILCAVAADPKKPTSQKPTPSKSTPASPASEAEPTPVDEPTTADKTEPVAGEDRGPWEVTDQMELVYKDKLEVAGDKTVSAKVLLKNKSEKELPGKLVLVVDGSSIEGATLQAPQGQFTEQTPYVQMLPAKRVLESGKETPVKTLILTTAESTKGLNLESASLRWRAFTLTKPAYLNDESTEDNKQVPGKGYTWGEMRKAMEIQSNATMGLVEKHEGAILGTGISEDANGQLVMLVYAAQGGMSRRLPGSIEGLPVQVTVTGVIRGGPAFSRVTMNDGTASVAPLPEPESATKPAAPAAESTGSASLAVAKPQAAQAGPPTNRFIRPVPIGVSIINQTDVCAAGTLGCRVFNAKGQQFILSNNHVQARENVGVVGQPICQPGRLEIGCATLVPDVVATLFDFQKIQFFTDPKLASTAPINTIDAAVSLCQKGMVNVITPIGGYGTPARTPQESLYIGMDVQKYGRTTIYTQGKIYGLNTEAIINYGAAGYARFKYCIDIRTRLLTPPFSAAGDSGSLVVTLADRRPVGLLFAGGGYDTFINPISPVLTRFKVGVDDNAGGTPVLGSGRTGTAVGPVKK